MADGWRQGTWLLVDAAGPELVTGLLTDGNWQAKERHREGIIESLYPGVKALLAQSGVDLPHLSGCLYASGPGSTLGLRLAAMFLSALMEMPDLRHWHCYGYNNLELGCASLLQEGNRETVTAYAPWRRDRLHRATVTAGAPPHIRSDYIESNRIEEVDAPCFILGNRMANIPATLNPVPYPTERIPEILNGFPALLRSFDAPLPYHAEDPEFVKWEQRRHGAR